MLAVAKLRLRQRKESCLLQVDLKERTRRYVLNSIENLLKSKKRRMFCHFTVSDFRRTHHQSFYRNKIWQCFERWFHHRTEFSRINLVFHQQTQTLIKFLLCCFGEESEPFLAFSLQFSYEGQAVGRRACTDQWLHQHCGSVFLLSKHKFSSQNWCSRSDSDCLVVLHSLIYILAWHSSNHSSLVPFFIFWPEHSCLWHFSFIFEFYVVNTHSKILHKAVPAELRNHVRAASRRETDKNRGKGCGFLIFGFEPF